MTHDPSALAATLLKNFVTVRFPPTETGWQPLGRDLSPEALLRCEEHAAKADAVINGCRRQALRLALLEHSYREFMDCLEAEPGGGWRIHLFLLDPLAVVAVSALTDGIVGPGDPVKFDPRRWVEHRVAQMVRVYERAGWWDWTGDALL